MTDQELDKLMRNVLADAAVQDEEKAENPDSGFTPSRRHQAQIRAMLKNPLAWAKNRNRPVWKRALQQAAAVALTFSLGFGVLMAASPDIRAAVVQWAVEWYENHIKYSYFNHEHPKEMPRYEISVLPEGYKEIEREEMPAIAYVTYENDVGNIIELQYNLLQQGGYTIINPQDDDILEVTVNQMKGQLFIPKNPESMRTITWIDEEANLQFFVDAVLNQDEILQLAESVSLVDEKK